jgi:hypothetical protein
MCRGFDEEAEKDKGSDTAVSMRAIVGHTNGQRQRRRKEESEQ